MPTGGVTDPAWGLMPRFAYSPSLGAVVRNVGDRREAAKRALQAIHDYEQTALKGRPVEGEASPLRHLMREAVLNYVTRRGKLFENWMPFSNSRRIIQPCVGCNACGQKTKKTRFTLRLVNVTSRNGSSCPRCGIIEDVPSNVRLGLFYDGDSTVRISGDLPRERWSARLLLGSQLPSDNIDWTWPMETDGSPRDAFKILGPWPVGPLSMSVILLWGANFAIVSRTTRKNQYLPE